MVAANNNNTRTLTPPPTNSQLIVNSLSSPKKGANLVALPATPSSAVKQKGSSAVTAASMVKIESTLSSTSTSNSNPKPTVYEKQKKPPRDPNKPKRKYNKTKKNRDHDDNDCLEIEISGNAEIIRTRPLITFDSESETEILIENPHAASEIRIPRTYTRRKPLKTKEEKEEARKRKELERAEREKNGLGPKGSESKKAKKSSVGSGSSGATLDLGNLELRADSLLSQSSLAEGEVDLAGNGEVEITISNPKAGRDYPKEAEFVFPEGSVDTIGELWKTLAKTDTQNWSVKDIVYLLCLCKLFGADEFKKIEQLTMPRMLRFTRKEMKNKMLQLERKNIILKDSKKRNLFFCNHDMLTRVVDDNVQRQRMYFVDNFSGLFKSDTKYISFVSERTFE